MANEKKRLETLLKKINAEIQDQSISSEEHVVSLFRVRDQGQMAMFKILGPLGAVDAPENATILEILGWNAATVEDHPVKKTVVGQINFVPDYLLKSDQRILAVVDLKGPDVNLDKWLGQISGYCHHLKIPLGLLFNGRELRVFVNTQIQVLQKYEESLDKGRLEEERVENRFANQFVASAEIRDLKQMVTLLSRFSAPYLKNNSLVLAKKLMAEAIENADNRKRKVFIEKKVQELLANPSDELLVLLSSLDVWQNPILPSGADIVEAWHFQTPTPLSIPATSPKASKKIPINLLVK